MHATLILWTMSLALAAPPNKAAPTGDPVLQHCLVNLIEEAQIPAQEAGALTKLNVREGAAVAKDTLLGQIDDSQVLIQGKAAYADYQAARQHAENDINIRFAKASALVAKAEYDKAAEAVRRTPGSITEAELNRLKLASDKAVLQIEQSELDMKVAKFTRDNKAAEVEAAENNLERRKIKSPLDGIVVAVNRHVGEWVQPAEPVFRVVRVDRLRVEGWLNTAQINPSQAPDKPVTVEVSLEGGRTEVFKGQIVFVSPLVEAGGEYRVWAEVDNRKENGQWLLRSGATATMTIHLK